MPRAASVRWTREHLLVALNLYSKIPFGKLHRGNPQIKEVAARMGRTASSLAIKLCNFASLDPSLRARGIVGMSGATKTDRLLWHEFHSEIEVLALESEQLLHDLITDKPDEEVDLLEPDRLRLEPSRELLLPTGPTEATALVKVRRGQQFFRQSILSAYGVRCCISGISVPLLLVASHIKPWSDFPDDRLDPRNGLCLSRIHDAEFDEGLITLDTNLQLVLSQRLRTYFPHPTLEFNFAQFEGKPIRLPEQRAEPSATFIDYHRANIFKD